MLYSKAFSISNGMKKLIAKIIIILIALMTIASLSFF